MPDSRKLNNNYRDYYFIKSDIEDLLGCSIDLNKINKKRSYDKLAEALSPQLMSLLPRNKIKLKEAANIIAGYQPFTDSYLKEDINIIKGYIVSLWEAVDEGILTGSDEITYFDFGQECREDITLNKNQVGKWAKKNNLNWPLPLDEDNEENNQYNNELEQRIKQLEEELDKQRTINSNLEATKPSEQVSINNNQNLTEKINQLKLDNQKLTEQLNESNKKFEELKRQIPILLGEYRQDDPLLLAIQIRNKEWANYNEQDRRTRPTQEAICEDLKTNYNVQTDQLAKAIELVSCPINRSK